MNDDPFFLLCELLKVFCWACMAVQAKANMMESNIILRIFFYSHRKPAPK